MRHRAADIILSICTLLAIAACFLIPTTVSATERDAKPGPRPPVHHANASASSQSTSSAAGGSVGAIDLSLMNTPVAGDSSFRTGNTYSLVSSAPPLPPGLCPKGDSVRFAWGLFEVQSVRTEHECLDKMLAYLREAIPKPTPAPITNYVVNHNYPAAAPAPATAPFACAPPPAKKKPAAKKPSVCK